MKKKKNRVGDVLPKVALSVAQVESKFGARRRTKPLYISDAERAKLDGVWRHEYESVMKTANSLTMTKAEKKYVRSTLPFVMNRIAINPIAAQKLVHLTNQIDHQNHDQDHDQNQTQQRKKSKSKSKPRPKSKSKSRKVGWLGWLAGGVRWVGRGLVRVLGYVGPIVRWLSMHPTILFLVVLGILWVKRKLCELFRPPVYHPYQRGGWIVEGLQRMVRWFSSTVADFLDNMADLFQSPWFWTLAVGIAAFVLYSVIYTYLGQPVAEIYLNLSAGVGAIYFLYMAVTEDCDGQKVWETQEEARQRKEKERVLELDVQVPNLSLEEIAQRSPVDIQHERKHLPAHMVQNDKIAIQQLQDFDANVVNQRWFKDQLKHSDVDRMQFWQDVKHDLQENLEDGRPLTNSQKLLLNKLNFWSTSTTCNQNPTHPLCSPKWYKPH
jgi:hypothetical protein